MIIYGSNSRNIKQAPLGETYECPDCRQKHSLLSIIASYVHIFWIPLFPYRKQALILCMNCERVVEDIHLEPNMRQKIKQLKGAVKLPWWMFSGLGIVMIFIMSVFVNDFFDEQERQSMITSPEIGDVYVIHDREETSEYDHYLMKVLEVTGDSLSVTVTSYSYNGIVNQLDREDGFYDISFVILKDEIARYDESGELKRIYRNYTSLAGFDRVVEYVIPDSTYVE